MAAKKTKRTPRPAPKPKEVTVKQVLSTWRAVAAMVTATAVIGSAAVWILSTQFARIGDVQKVSGDVRKVVEDQTDIQYKLETKDLELSGAMSLVKADEVNLQTEVGSMKSDIKEIRKDQQQTNENLIRLMERFSVQPVKAQ